MLCGRRVLGPLPARLQTRTPPPFLQVAKILRKNGFAGASDVLWRVCFSGIVIITVVGVAFVGHIAPGETPSLITMKQLAGDFFYDSPGTTVDDLRRLLRYIERNSDVSSWDDDMTVHFLFPLIQRRGGRR